MRNSCVCYLSSLFVNILCFAMFISEMKKKKSMKEKHMKQIFSASITTGVKRPTLVFWQGAFPFDFAYTTERSLKTLTHALWIVFFLDIFFLHFHLFCIFDLISQSVFPLLSSHKDNSDISHDEPVAFFALEEDWYALASTLRIFSLNGFFCVP